MPVETSKTEGELTKEAPVFTGASPAKVLSKSHHTTLFPELSPTTTTEKYFSLLSDTSTGMGRGVSQTRLISDIQKGYGNRYTERVIAEYREKSKEDLEGKEEPTEAKETEKVTVPKEAKETPILESEVKVGVRQAPRLTSSARRIYTKYLRFSAPERFQYAFLPPIGRPECCGLHLIL